MKKKILIIVAVVVVLVGGTVAVLALTGGGATEEDHAQGEETADEVDKTLENANTDLPESKMNDAAADSLEEALGIDEEFDPNDI
ncbi:MAG: hypothetical protein H6599_07220 [Flavobacteriales bacterium]|nr:hypothetical protein [Flavobacteriales bacterium]